MTAPHPLDPLSAEELARAAKLILADSRVGRRPQFSWVARAEPEKAAVLTGDPIDRRADAVVVDRVDGATYEVTVNLVSGVVERADRLEGLHGGLVFDEFLEAQEAARHPDVRAALVRRGVPEDAEIYVEPWPAGWFDRPYDRQGRRLGRAVFYVRGGPLDQPWARPVQGLVAVWDRTTHEILELIDDGDLAVPDDPGRFDAAAPAVGPVRDDLRPLHVHQPEGPSFTLEGNELTWQRWSMRLSMHPIEGLVLHRVGYDDPRPPGGGGPRRRSVLYRAAMAEMVVPYGDPQPQHFWRHVFDEGEVGMGRTANPLELGCDCLGEIRYLDAPMILGDGTVSVVDNAICIHEEDVGVLWRHRDRNASRTEVRRDRRLVVSYWATLGNYDYGYFWYFHQDGTIELEVKLTGIPLASALPAGRPAGPYETRVSDELSAPHHQHFFCWRLDLDVDGAANVVEEVDIVADPVGPANPYGNAFRRVATPLRRESEAKRCADPLASRTWRVSNPAVRNAYGDPVGYQVQLGPSPVLLAAEGSAVARRAAFARHHLWVTPYDPAEQRAAGAHPTQHPGGAGLPAYTAGDRPLDNGSGDGSGDGDRGGNGDGTDVVLWLTCGSTHVARPEEWPIMPVERTGFTLRPVGFFDRNPSLDVAPPAGHVTA